MLYWALMFFVVALIAGVLGFTGVAVAAAGVREGIVLNFSSAVCDFTGCSSHAPRGLDWDGSLARPPSYLLRRKNLFACINA
jgi:uncharacterized membrane protein YtjA (UPF0391 family)